LNETVDMGGIPAFKYTIPEKALASVKKNPENKCYCSNPGEDYEKCLQGGAWELAACKEGTPMVASFPHFYGAAEVYRQGVEGLHPDKDKHELVIVMEPTAAISLKVAIRVQMNFAITPTKVFKQLKKVPTVLHPLFWMDQGVTLPPETLGMVREKLIRTQEMVKMGSFSVVIFGVVLVIVAAAIFWCRSRKVTVTRSTYKANIAETQLSNPAKSDRSTVPPVGYSRVESPPTNDWSQEQQPFIPQSQGNNAHKPRVAIPVSPPVVNYTAATPRSD